MRSIQRKVRTKKRPGARVVNTSKDRECYICNETITNGTRALQQSIIDTREKNDRDILTQVYMHISCAKKDQASKSVKKVEKRKKKNIFE